MTFFTLFNYLAQPLAPPFPILAANALTGRPLPPLPSLPRDALKDEGSGSSATVMIVAFGSVASTMSE